MKTFLVDKYLTVRVCLTYKVEAESIAEALAVADDGGGEFSSEEWVDVIDSDPFTYDGSLNGETDGAA